MRRRWWPQRAVSGACRSPRSFQALDIFADLLLQLPELPQRAFGEDAKVSRVLTQNFVPIGLEDTLHASHLFNGLVKLFGCFNHSSILKMPLLTPGHCLT